MIPEIGQLLLQWVSLLCCWWKIHLGLGFPSLPICWPTTTTHCGVHPKRKEIGQFQKLWSRDWAIHKLVNLYHWSCFLFGSYIINLLWISNNAWNLMQKIFKFQDPLWTVIYLFIFSQICDVENLANLFVWKRKKISPIFT